MMANQLRMWFSAMAYVLVDTLRRVGLHFTQFADASAQTIRLKLLKLGAQVRTSVRRIHFAMASGCPNKIEFELAYIYLRRVQLCVGAAHVRQPGHRRPSHDTCLSHPHGGKDITSDSHCARQMKNTPIGPGGGLRMLKATADSLVHRINVGRV